MAGSQKRRVIYPQDTGGLPQSEITIATALKSKGYATACIGKWHLGHQPESQPTAHGFELFLGLPYSNDMDRTPGGRKADTASLEPSYEDFNVPLIRNGEVVERPAVQTTLTKRYTEEALRFIRANRRKPFFLYIPHTFPHVPLFASEKFKGKSPRGLYGDTVEEIDWSVGEILKVLREERLAGNTLVVFTSDNGPWLVKNLAGGTAGLLRDGKGSTWEGGMRVPAIAWWPGKIKAGSVTRELACSMDLFNTSLKLAGAPLPTDRIMDGVDISPILLGAGKSLRETMFYYRGGELSAVRKGAFKAHFETAPGYGSPGSPLTFEKHDPPLLFNVVTDPSERFNIAGEHLDVIAEIRRIVEAHRAKLAPATMQY
jgi:arylsulfatase A-like enzyme